MNTVNLEKLKIGLQQMITEELVDADIDVALDWSGRNAVIQIRGYVWAESEKVTRQEVKYPADWKQAFKERWFPKWLLSHFPVTWHTVTLDVRAIYPDFRPALRDNINKLVIQRYDDIHWETK